MNDYKRDFETNDLVIANGDFVRTESTTQHQKSLLLAQPGSYKQFPTVGVGMAGFINDEDTGEMMRAIRQQFTGDGMAVNRLGMVNGKLSIDAGYEG